MWTKLKNINNLVCCLSALLMIIGSCSKMDSNYDRYLKKGENNYIGKVDSARVLPGNNRILLRYWVSDPRAKKLIVYWMSRHDSVLLNIPDKASTDSVDVFIENLNEGNYNFEMITMDKESEYKSVPFEIGGNVYGDQFQSTIINRSIKNKEYDSLTHKLTIIWGGNVEKSVGCDLKYIDTLNATIEKLIPVAEDTTIFMGLKGSIMYRTMFLPEETAIDTFYTSFTPISLN